MTKIIIIDSQQKNNDEILISKVLNGKFSPEIKFLDFKDFKKSNFDDCETYILYNSDNDMTEEIKESVCKKVDFGFNDNASFRASDVNITNESINFKLNFRGNSVPIWLVNYNHTNNADEIYSILSAICVGDIVGMNIVEISENLKK